MDYRKRSINQWVEICYADARNAGWHTNDNGELPSPKDLAVKIALIHSELSEALEGVRRGNRDEHLPDRTAVEVELADAIIRIFDLAGLMQFDLEGAMFEKMEYNRRRGDHKPEARSAVGGKRF